MTKVVVIHYTAGYTETASATTDVGISVNGNGDLLVVDVKGRPCAAVAAGRWAKAIMEDSEK